MCVDSNYVTKVEPQRGQTLLKRTCLGAEIVLVTLTQALSQYQSILAIREATTSEDEHDDEVEDTN